MLAFVFRSLRGACVTRYKQQHTASILFAASIAFAGAAIDLLVLVSMTRVTVMAVIVIHMARRLAVERCSRARVRHGPELRQRLLLSISRHPRGPSRNAGTVGHDVRHHRALSCRRG